VSAPVGEDGWTTNHAYVGRRIERSFGGIMSPGTITKYLSTTGPNDPALWHVVYDDTDEEDLEQHEVKAAMASMAKKAVLAPAAGGGVEPESDAKDDRRGRGRPRRAQTEKQQQEEHLGGGEVEVEVEVAGEGEGSGSGAGAKGAAPGQAARLPTDRHARWLQKHCEFVARLRAALADARLSEARFAEQAGVAPEALADLLAATESADAVVLQKAQRQLEAMATAKAQRKAAAEQDLRRSAREGKAKEQQQGQDQQAQDQREALDAQVCDVAMTRTAARRQPPPMLRRLPRPPLPPPPLPRRPPPPTPAHRRFARAAPAAQPQYCSRSRSAGARAAAGAF
jgi:hypothetical protein